MNEEVSISLKKKVVKPRKKYNVKPSAKALQAMKIMTENVGISKGEAMRMAGYSKSVSESPKKLTGQASWQDMMDNIIPESMVFAAHKKMFCAKKVDYFSFPKDMSDREIIEHVASVGIKVINIRHSDKGKLAFYASDDNQAIKAAIDMANKMRKRYEDEDQKKNVFNNHIIVGMKVILEK